MAKVVTELPKRKGGGKGRAEKYNYDEWLDGQIWQLEEGTDFEVNKMSFMTSVRGAAKKRDLKLKSRVTDDAVIIQAEPLTDEDRKANEARAKKLAASRAAGKTNGKKSE